MKERQYSNMTEALKGLSDLGYKENFLVEENNLKVPASGDTYKPDQLKVVDTYRFEGESDPDDMAVLYVIETNDGKKGTLIDAFGTYGDKDIGDFVSGLKDVRDVKEPTNAVPPDKVN